MDNLQDLLVDQCRDLYNAEGQLMKALPKMAKAASDPQLQRAFQQHLQQTQGQMKRLEQVFAEMGVPVKGKQCKAMKGLIEEGDEIMKEKREGDPDVIDAGLIAAAQKVEHYEMASYGCVKTYAQELGFATAARLLEQTLNEEKETDAKLTQLAEAGVNRRAEEGNGNGSMRSGRSSSRSGSSQSSARQSSGRSSGRSSSRTSGTRRSTSGSSRRSSGSSRKS